MSRKRACRFYRFCRLFVPLLFLLPTGIGTRAVGDSTAESPGRQASRVLSDDWETIYLNDVRAGYGRTRVVQLDRGGTLLRQTDSVMRLNVRRFGQPMEASVTIQSTEDLEGRLIDFRTEMVMGSGPVISSGRVVGEKLEITTQTGETVVTAQIDWSDKDHGFFYDRQLLREKPMRPGERREFSALVPIFNKLAHTELIAGEYQQTKLLEEERRLLPITSRTTLGDQQIESRVWTDEQGEVLKVAEESLDQTVYRTSRKVALAGQQGKTPDLIVDTMVPLGGEVKSPQTAHRVRYRVRLKRSDPQGVFPNSATQKVESKSNREIELVVSRSGAGQQDRAVVAERPTLADRSPSRLIQSDDEQVVALAGQVAVDEKDASAVARALERHVYELIDKKDFSTALGSAAEVARSRRGDCTEHAVLLAALARARGLASRVVVGLVYVPSLGGFGYHMWTELWLQDHWLALDATRAGGGTGGGHIKIAHASLSDADGLMVFLPVLKVIGQMQLEVLEEVHD